jgi:hypothetical protein
MASLLLMREKGQGGRCGDPILGSASTAASSSPRSDRTLRIGSGWVVDTIAHTMQVAARRAFARTEVERTALETALTTSDVEELRRSTEAGWRSEQDAERLRAGAVRTCEEALVRAQRMLERIRATQDKEELREVGLEAVRTAGRDTLCAMAVQAAAQKGVDVNTRVEAGEKRWLEVAAKGGLVETVRALVFLGAEVDHADGLGYTALYTAAAHGETEAVRALAAAGADVNRVDKVGETALCVAAASGHAGVIRALVKAGAGVNHANRDTGETALCR